LLQFYVQMLLNLLRKSLFEIIRVHSRFWGRSRLPMGSGAQAAAPYPSYHVAWSTTTISNSKHFSQDEPQVRPLVFLSFSFRSHFHVFRIASESSNDCPPICKLPFNSRLIFSNIYGFMVSMKTTIEVSDELYREVKSQAALRGMKIKDFLVQGLRLALEEGAATAAVPSTPAAVFNEVRQRTLHDSREIRSLIEKNHEDRKTDWRDEP